MRGIYSITNILTGTVYYGQAININKRFREHLCSLNNNRHRNIHLQRAWNKYGKKVFIFVPIEIVENLSINLTTIEKKYFDSTTNRYNIREPEMKFPLSEETKQRISNANKGGTGRIGYIHSKETKRKISKSNKGKKGSRIGKTNSEEQNKKISETHKGHKNPRFGKPVSVLTRKKLSIASKQYWNRIHNGNL